MTQSENTHEVTKFQTTVPVSTESAPANAEAPRIWASAPVDILEGEDAYLVIADVPGVDRSGVSLQYEDGSLRIEAHRNIDGATGWPTHYRRVLAVGQEVEVEKITAELEHGILQVTLPKRAAAKPRTIEIKLNS